MASSLFRTEVLAARRDLWLGEAQIVPPLPVKAVAVASFLMTGAFALFLVFGFYTRRVHAEGMLAPKTGLITIASPTAGRISSAGVSEGDRVEKGQLLFSVDVDAVSSNGPTQKQVLTQLRAQKVSVETQRATRLSVAGLEKKALEDQIANSIAQEEGMKKQATLQKQLTQSLKDRADELKVAVDKGLARASDHQMQKFLYIQANTQLAQFEQGRLQLVGKISEMRAKLAEFDGNLTRDIAEKDRQSAQLQQQIAESDAKRSIEIRSPERGVLTSLRVHVGQQVPAGGTLLTLLPNVGNLQANLYVDSSAIGFVAKGEPVMLRYAAFPFQRFGLYRGEVVEMTRAPIDALDEPGNKKDDPAKPEKKSVYRIIVKPDEGFVLAFGEHRALEAGMQVEADIALEKRPLFRWLLDPVYRLKRSATLVTEGASR